MNSEKVFLFPLPRVVYWPVLKKPLNIFEPRYVKMVKNAIAQNIPICLCYGLSTIEQKSIQIEHESLAAVKVISGAGGPTILQKSSESDEMLITLDPISKYEILSIEPMTEPYIIAQAKRVLEFESVLPENILLLNQIEALLRKWSKQYFRDKSQYQELIKEFKDPVLLIGTYCEFVIDNQHLKQSILELDDINDKLKLISEYFPTPHN